MSIAEVYTGLRSMHYWYPYRAGVWLRMLFRAGVCAKLGLVYDGICVEIGSVYDT